ncbi:MAG: hypothetical protein ACLP4V_25435 [Methylocella sp.]
MTHQAERRRTYPPRARTVVRLASPDSARLLAALQLRLFGAAGGCHPR